MELFPAEDQDTRHPDDARHWAEVYANLLRTLPSEMKATAVERKLRARVEFWEGRYRELGEHSAELISPFNRNRPPRVRKTARAAADPSAARPTAKSPLVTR